MLGNNADLLSDIHLSINAAKVGTLFGYKDGDVDEVTYLIDGLSPDYISYSFVSVTTENQEIGIGGFYYTGDLLCAISVAKHSCYLIFLLFKKGDVLRKHLFVLSRFVVFAFFSYELS